MRDAGRARSTFLVLFGAVMLVKLLVAWRLPLFVDEAFYWQEGQHLAPAYSDLPGLTAWLTRLGTVFGDSTLALRFPFLLLGAWVPWLVVRITVREFGERHGWIAGSLALLLPLSGTLGLLALPDAAMAVATLLCMDAGAKLLRKVDAGTALELAFGLAIGALSHYRFIAVIGVGFLALLSLADGRRILRDPRVWTAIAFGAMAWTPLVAWNFDNADAGLRFQLVDRHPWSFHVEGFLFLLIQALMVTPLLFAAMGLAGWGGIRAGTARTKYFALLGVLVIGGFFALGFFADTERVSFHWPLPGYLALLPLLPALLERWTPPWRSALWATSAIGLVAVLGYYVVVSVPEVRTRTATGKWYPSNFAGWDALADAVREELDAMPDDTLLVADNFKVGAELGFALGDPDIPVLDHPLNTRHGRAPQLRLWGLETPGREAWGDRPVLLVAGVGEVKFSELLSHYQSLCARTGSLPPPQVLNIDHGEQRFLLFKLQGRHEEEGACVPPALAHFNAPLPGTRVPVSFDVQGWAIKDAVGVSGVTITLDGRPVANAEYGVPDAWVAGFYRGRSTDPNHPDIGFRARVDASGFEPGQHWLGMIVHGADGSSEAWAESGIWIEKAGIEEAGIEQILSEGN